MGEMKRITGSKKWLAVLMLLILLGSVAFAGTIHVKQGNGGLTGSRMWAAWTWAFRAEAYTRGAHGLKPGEWGRSHYGNWVSP